LRAGDHFLDLGANVGILTVLGSRLVGKQGRVLAVEPNPAVIEMLEETLAANQCENVTIGRYALGEENGELPLQIPERNMGGAALGKSGDNGVTVPVRVLREVLAEEELETPRIVKIDVEGFEVPVLKGVLDEWRERPPEMILFEHRDREPAGASETGQLLRQLGFELHRLPRSWFRVSLITEGDDFQWDQVSPDVVAVQPGSAAATALGVTPAR
jgi:FkbM family methyltransferase